MRKFNQPHKTTATIISILIVLIVFTIFVYRIVFISVPPQYIKITTNYSANIYSNTIGIPHIIANDDNDMFFALGYYTARERLWQMINIKFICQGRMAEHLGNDYIEVDMFMRSFYIDKIAEKCFMNADDYTKNVLKHYCNGVNQFIKDREGKLQIEFAAAGVVPELWQPKDCFIMLRYWAFVMSNNVYSDIITSNIINKLGIQALDLFPKYPNNSPHILDNIIYDEKDNQIYIQDTTDMDINIFANNNMYEPLIKTISTDYNKTMWHTLLNTTLQEDNLIAANHFNQWFIQNEKVSNNLYNIISRRGSNLGSNTWAVATKENKITEKYNFTTLGTDSHLPTNLINAWMQLHISSKNYNVVGLCLPGAPIVLTGRNDNIAWGCANMMIDDIDYFVHRFNDTNRMKYLDCNNNYCDVVNIIDTIKIKGRLDSFYYQSIIERCPVISDMDVMKNTNTNIKTINIKTKNYLTYKWTGSQISNEIGAMLNIMRSNNWNDFLIGADNWNSPGMVFCYADIKGNIGVAPRGIVPKRNENIDGRIVNPYWKYEHHWVGFIKPKDIPTSYNPRKKYVVAMNNSVLRDTNKYISSCYSLDSRVKRFNELIFNIVDYNYRDAQIMQKDVVDFYAKDLLNKLNYIFKRYKYLLNEVELKAYNKLQKWDYAMQTHSTSASIFNMFLCKMLYNTFADELGDLYDLYIHNPNIAMQKLFQLCNNAPNSIWFDNIKTADKIERLNYITITSFKDAISELTKLYGTDNTDKWQYGKYHRMSLNRSFNYYPAINNITNMGTYSIAGSISTINCAEWNLLNPFEVVLGTTMRFVADMSSDNCYTILLGGISGDAMSPHYANQINFFNIGAYSILSIKRSPGDKFKLKVKISKE